MLTRSLLLGFFLYAAAVAAEHVEKSVFLFVEPGRVVASMAATGQFFDLDMGAKETIEAHHDAGGVAVVITNQRFAGIGAFPTGWSSTRRMAGEEVVSVEAADYAALIVTTSRLLSFSGRTGAWAITRR